MIRGLSLRSKKAVPSPLDLSSLFDHYHQLERLRAEVTSTHTKWLAEADAKLARLDELIASVKIPAKGDKPVAGVDYPIPKNGKSVVHSDVVADVLRQIKPETPVIDHVKIARLAAQLITLPKPEKINHAMIAERTLELLTTGKKKLHIKNIEGFNEGLEQTIAPIRHLAAGFRGGGDTVAAGSNITITNVGGVKTITSTGGGTTVSTPTGTVDGSNTTFVAAATPLYIVVDGVTYFENNGYTRVGLTITTSVPPGGFIRVFS